MPSHSDIKSMDTEKKRKPISLLTLLFLMIIACCASSMSAKAELSEEDCWNHYPMNVGILKVWHDRNALYVVYDMTHAETLGIASDFEIAETRLAVGGISMADSAGPNPCPFPFREKHVPSVQTFTYVIDFAEWDQVPDEFYVAAQAVLVPSQPKEIEWTDGREICETEFDWSTYFNYTLKLHEGTNGIQQSAGGAGRRGRLKMSNSCRLASY